MLAYDRTILQEFAFRLRLSVRSTPGLARWALAGSRQWHTAARPLQS